MKCYAVSGGVSWTLVCHLGHLEGMSTLLNTLQSKDSPFLSPKLVVIVLALAPNMYHRGLADHK